jgi:transcriptional pleiotropic regulator of transition state genes
MKTTGIIRCIDQLGRLVIPKEMRRALKIEEGDGVEISLEGKRIIVQKHEESCIFCASSERLATFEGKRVCQKCLSKLSEM